MGVVYRLDGKRETRCKEINQQDVWTSNEKRITFICICRKCTTTYLYTNLGVILEFIMENNYIYMVMDLFQHSQLRLLFISFYFLSLTDNSFAFSQFHSSSKSFWKICIINNFIVRIQTLYQVETKKDEVREVELVFTHQDQGWLAHSQG